MEPYLYQFTAVVQIMHFFGAIWKIYIKFGNNLALKLKKIVQKRI